MHRPAILNDFSVFSVSFGLIFADRGNDNWLIKYEGSELVNGSADLGDPTEVSVHIFHIIIITFREGNFRWI